MASFTTSPIPRLGAALAALVVAGSLQADPPRRKVSTPATGVHQMELLNGSTRTVRSFGIGLSTSEAASLSDLDRLENEAAFAHDVQALKRQYVSDERLLEPHRRNLQQDLYGRSLTRSSYGSLTSSGGYGGYGYGGLGYGGLSQTSSGSVGGQSAETFNLAYGVGNEGPLKNDLAALIAKQAAPGYSAAVAQEYRQAVIAAAYSPRLRASLRLPTTEQMRKDDNAIRAADYETPAADRVTLTLSNGKKVVGSRLQEGKDWITLVRADGGTSRYRLSQVVQIDLPVKGLKVKPAADE